MITFDPAGPSREELQWVVAHEIGHQWTPMVVGEQRAALPLDGRGLQHLHRPRQQREVLRRHALRRLDRGASAAPLSRPRRRRPGAAAHHPAGGEPRPLLDRLPEAGAHDAGAALSRCSARKPSTRPSATTCKTWAFKHPTPADFFRIMRDNTGVELDWFWTDWVYGTTRPDIAVEAIDNGEKGSTVTLREQGHDAAADPAAAHLRRRQRRER